MTFDDWWEKESGWGGEHLAEYRLAKAAWDNDQIKADAIMEFVNMMIGAYESGFTDRANCTLEEVYRVARSHIFDTYKIKTPHIIDAWGADLAKDMQLTHTRG